MFFKGHLPEPSWLLPWNQVQFPIPIARKAQVISMALYLHQTVSQTQGNEKKLFSHFITKPVFYVLISHTKIHFLLE